MLTENQTLEWLGDGFMTTLWIYVSPLAISEQRMFGV